MNWRVPIIALIVAALILWLGFYGLSMIREMMG